MKKLNKFHNTKLGYLLFGFVELAVADGFFSLAIDRGNPFWYLLTIIFLVGALQNIFKLVGTFIDATHAKNRR